MANEHCIRFRPLCPTVVLRADFLAICENSHCAALVLSQMMHWYEIKTAHRQQAQITNQQAAAIGEAQTQDESAWVWKKQEHLHVELMGAHGINAIGNALTWLVAKGFLRERPNPKNTWDRTKQYLFDVARVQAAVDALPTIPTPPDTDAGDDNASAPRSRVGKSGANEPLELNPQSDQNRDNEATGLNQRGFNSKASTLQNRGLSYKDNVEDYIHKKTATDNPRAQTQAAPVSDATAAAFLNKSDVCNDKQALIAELAVCVVGMNVGIDEGDAHSIVLEAFRSDCEKSPASDRVRRACAWFPKSTQCATAGNVGKVFRCAVRGDWAKAAAIEDAARAAEAHQSQIARRYVTAPTAQQQGGKRSKDKDNDENAVAAVADLAARLVVQAPPRPITPATPLAPPLALQKAEKAPAVDTSAIWETLSSCAKDRVHKEAISRAAEGAPFMSDALTEVPIDAGAETRGGAARLVLATRSEILRERAAEPFLVNGKKFYDEVDARAAQTELDFN